MGDLVPLRPVAARLFGRSGLAVAAWLAVSGFAFGQGIAFRGVSAINESMAGVATATPVDSAGAIHWNPATICGLPSSDMSFGMTVLLPHSTLASQVGPVAGTTDSEPGTLLAPNMALVRKASDSPWSYGLGMFAIGGSKVNYPASLTNPILSPSPPFLGRLSAEVQAYQIVPTIAYQLNENVSIGVAPTITIAQVIVNPLIIAPLDPVTHEYPPSGGTRYAWGGGLQAGVYLSAYSGWNYGFSVASPQWMENFRFNSQDAFGRPQHVEFHLNYPMILSLGTSYSGWERWIVGCDVRYFDYANTVGFARGGFNADGSLAGLGWNSVMSVAVAAQYQAGERLFLRGGYCFSENPIGSAAVQENAASPLVIQHSLHTGLSFMFDDDWLASVAYVHAFDNSVAGPLRTLAGTPIPGTSLRSTAGADVLSFEVSKRF